MLFCIYKYITLKINSFGYVFLETVYKIIGSLKLINIFNIVLKVFRIFGIMPLRVISFAIEKLKRSLIKTK